MNARHFGLALASLAVMLVWMLALGLAGGAEKKPDPAAAASKAATSEASDTMGAPCPEGGIVLLGKEGTLSEWQPEKDPNGTVGWPVENGAMTINPKAGSIVTKRTFRDFRLHLEFLINEGGIIRSSGNSGVYIQERYEVQILNSFGKNPPGASDCGAIYRTKAPDVNASRPASEWQTFDLVFRAPRWDASDKKTANARISVRHNGRLIHNDVEIPNKTGRGKSEGPSDGPIKLQGHGNPVKFRNIWIVPM